MINLVGFIVCRSCRKICDRISERFLYQKIKDIYTTSIDYDAKSDKTSHFFKVVQNKLLWAISQQSLAELEANIKHLK
jgi:hypothetical protein